MECLTAYSWPGNVRELRNLIERIVVLAPSDEVGPEHLPEEIFEDPRRDEVDDGNRDAMPGAELGYHEAMRESQRRILEDALERSGGNQAEAARLLGLNRTYLSRLMKQTGLR
jgi:DNA-binding NtrC family response regulator